MLKGTVTNPFSHHLNENAFRNYESWLIRLTECYPEPLVITPIFANGQPRNTVSFMKQLRHAANAYLQGRFTTSFTFDRFAECWSGTVVRENGTQVIVAPKTTPIAEALGREEAVTAPTQFLMELTSPTAAQLLAAASLYATGATMKPTRVLGDVPNVTLPEGVSLYPHEAGGFLLL